MNIISRAVAALLPLLLAACLSQNSAPTAAPLGFVATPGEGRVTLTWTSEPGLTYWVYYKAGTTVSKDDFTAINYGVTTPAVISGLTNGTQYAFLITASNDGSKTGPASPVQIASPRLVTQVTNWTVGTPLATGGNNLTGIAFGSSPNLFVTVGDNATVFTATHSYTSPGGVTAAGWTAATTLPTGYSADLSAVIYDGARFVAMGTDGSIITSTDAATWAAGTGIAAAAGMHALAHDGGTTYVAVGDGGKIYRNTSAGVTAAWTAVGSGTGSNLYGVSYAGGKFIAVGAAGAVRTSPDGITWTTQTSNTPNDLHQVAYGTSKYVAVGNAGAVISSTDAITWTVQSLPTTASLRTICFRFGAQFIAAGTAGTIISSSTGADGSWAAINPSSIDLNSIVASDVYIAVGDAGANVSGK